jgi:hypothetical protein
MRFRYSHVGFIKSLVISKTKANKKFNNLINILKLSLKCWPKLFINK